jgi:hypothetical protein
MTFCFATIGVGSLPQLSESIIIENQNEFICFYVIKIESLKALGKKEKNIFCGSN